MKSLSLVLALLCASVAANAATITKTFTFGPSTTNWGNVFLLPQFDPTLGTLQSAYFEMGTSAVSNLKVESLDAAAATVTYSHGFDVIMQSLSTGLLVSLHPSRSGSVNLTAFDGVIDFGGTSGMTLPPMSLTDSGNLTIIDPSVLLATYTGLGNLSITVSATGHSNFAGAGNLITQATGMVGATGRVVYTYSTNTVPEPATYAMMGLGLLGLGILRRRKA